jgi:hypothetical protein
MHLKLSSLTKALLSNSLQFMHASKIYYHTLLTSDLLLTVVFMT